MLLLASQPGTVLRIGPRGHVMITERYVNGTYFEEAPNWHAEDSPWKAAQVSKILTRNRVNTRSITDIGCGVGVVLTELQRDLPEDASLMGFDVSPQAIALAKIKENKTLHFREGDFFQEDSTFQDVVLVLDVLEHVEDYLGFLEQIKGRAAWAVFHIPLDISVLGVLRGSQPMLYMREKFGHLHYFTKETALATLNSVGFAVVDHWYTDDLAIPGAAPKSFVRQVYHYLRKCIFWLKPDLAVSLFNSFSMLVLVKVEP